jgi:hypothetical protein
VSNPNGKKGAGFERQTADYWRDNWEWCIDRRVKTGAKDKGDLANVRVRGYRHQSGLMVPETDRFRLVVECKNERGMNLAGWVKEAQEEAVNDDALIGLVVAKRKGKGDPADQYVILTQGDLMKLLKTVTGP